MREASIAFLAGILVAAIVVLAAHEIVDAPHKTAVPPPADRTHRIVQETCLRCHIAEEVIR